MSVMMTSFTGYWLTRGRPRSLARRLSSSRTALVSRTPSLSIRGSVRVRSLVFAQAAWLSGIHPATERLSEPERALILDILATRHPPSRLVLDSH
jgi:hypothetical protein